MCMYFSVVSKMDGWARQGELWRSDIENQLADMNKQLRLAERYSKNHEEQLAHGVTQRDLDALKDKIQVHIIYCVPLIVHYV
jgi:hypothetical protein